MKQAGGGPGGVGTDRSWREIPLCQGGAPMPEGKDGGGGPASRWLRARGVHRQRQSGSGLSAKQSGQAGGRLDEE